jgi:hypothetical protein
MTNVTQFIIYSVLKDLTGLTIAAAAVLITTVDKAMKNMTQNKIPNNLKLTPSLNANTLTTELLTIYPNGMHIAPDIIINFKNPTDSSFTIVRYRSSHHLPNANLF